MTRNPKTGQFERIPLEESFWQKVGTAESSELCWLWIGSLHSNGYGQFRNLLAHRFSYTLHKGPIPYGLQIDHLCRNRGCVNPKHLEAVTGKTNLLRGISFSAKNAAKTVCHKGHPLESLPNGWRFCRTCSKASQKKYYHLNRRKCIQRVVTSRNKRLSQWLGDKR